MGEVRAVGIALTRPLCWVWSWALVAAFGSLERRGLPRKGRGAGRRPRKHVRERDFIGPGRELLFQGVGRVHLAVQDSCLTTAATPPPGGGTRTLGSMAATMAASRAGPTKRHLCALSLPFTKQNVSPWFAPLDIGQPAGKEL